jgi:magnesium and cobalt transporter
VDEKLNIRAQADGRFTIQANTEIDEFNDYFESDMSADQFDTVGGLVSQKAGKIPQQGEEIILLPFTFTVLRSDGRKIQLLEVRKLEE